MGLGEREKWRLFPTVRKAKVRLKSVARMVAHYTRLYVVGIYHIFDVFFRILKHSLQIVPNTEDFFLLALWPLIVALWSLHAP